jgi:hypothetical protein
MEQMMGLLLIQFDERNRKNSPERPRESYFVQYGKDQMAASNSWTMQRNQLWITLTLTANQSAADVVFRSASHFDFESLIFHNREPDRWKSTHRNTAMRFHLHLDQYATIICARSRSQRIISTRRLPEMIREMKTLMLTGFIYSRMCDIIDWISNASLNRFYKICGNYKFELEISKSAKVERNLW